jgi:peroxiredoxin family protein
MDANRFNHITVTNQKELDEFLNDTTIDKLMYCIDVRSDEPLVVETHKAHNFRIFDSSVVTFSKIPVLTTIDSYDDAVAIIASENCYLVQGYDNSTIIKRNENSNISYCDLFHNAKLKNESLNTDVPCEMRLDVYNISTQERLDECLNLYENYENVHLHIIDNALEPGAELVVNKKIDGDFELRNESRVVFKSPTNTDNDSIDYYIFAFGKSTAIIETNNCAIRASDQSRIVKRCKDDIVDLRFVSKYSKLIDESHLLDTNKHKETSKGRCK